MLKLALKNAVNAIIGTFMEEIGPVMKILDKLTLLIEEKPDIK